MITFLVLGHSEKEMLAVNNMETPGAWLQRGGARRFDGRLRITRNRKSRFRLLASSLQRRTEWRAGTLRLIRDFCPGRVASIAWYDNCRYFVAQFGVLRVAVTGSLFVPILNQSYEKYVYVFRVINLLN
jgi:hypothetical protein